MGGGIPLPHEGVFAFLGFKISDLVHNIGEFDDVHATLEEGIGGKGFRIFRVQNKRSCAYFR